MAAISAKAISYTFDTGEGARPVLHDVDLAVDPGEFVILTGPSGSGKTTLLSLVGALRRPQQGELTVLGRDVAALRGRDLEAFRRRIGFVVRFLTPEVDPSTAEAGVATLVRGVAEGDRYELRTRFPVSWS